jgi:ring-1,2-phenylacetyl-CoA epoxidase subunit PaaA
LIEKPVRSGASLTAKKTRFDAKIFIDGNVETQDWGPDAYRKALILEISQYAHFGIIVFWIEANFSG